MNINFANADMEINAIYFFFIKKKADEFWSVKVFYELPALRIKDNPNL